MVKYGALILSLFISPILLAEETKPADAPIPKIYFPEKEHSWGEVIQGTQAAYPFVFKNTGNAPLKIIKIQTSCGCTAAIAGKNELAPQESSEINVTFNSAGRQGEFSKAIQVYSNDPQSPKFELMIHGKIRTLLQIQSPTLNFGVMKLGSSAEREIKIKADAYDQPLKMTQVDKSDRLEVVMKDPVITQKDWTILTVLFKADTPGNLNERVVLRFENPAVNPVTVPVIGRVEGPIRVIPPRLNFIVRSKVGKPMEWPSQRVILTRTDGSTFKIVNVDLDPQFFDVQTVVKEEGKSYEIVIRVKEGIEQRLFSKVMKVSTDDKVLKEIDIPVQVWIPATSQPAPKS
ncbi:MAG: DUF1573 domain-containing protein [Chlamydiae bacterium]|nr:DUF1573 domain-containing protein [Chlamydiota bacterium]MBI3265746.1 DUF1573 domain-containing protein [Chlamydiota bacterium]